MGCWFDDGYDDTVDDMMWMEIPEMDYGSLDNLPDTDLFLFIYFILFLNQKICRKVVAGCLVCLNNSRKDV